VRFAVKATDENLTSENWEFIMVRCGLQQSLLDGWWSAVLMVLLDRMFATRLAQVIAGELDLDGDYELAVWLTLWE
jgi:hypothetical protein